MSAPLRRAAAVLGFILIFSSILIAQTSSCQAPVLTPSSQPNLFPGTLERDFGDVAAESFDSGARFIEDEKVNAYVKRVGMRIARQFPPNNLDFRFYVVEAPVANAYALPGGRVYITRKLLNHVISEDELAVILAHEIGHLVTHQKAIEWTAWFNAVLGQVSFNDREDIENKFHELIESERAHKVKDVKVSDEKYQIDADQVAVYAVAAAGYDPHVAPLWWDRFVEAKGNQGSWWSDFFGTTTERSKRLREFVKTAGSIPQDCIKPTIPEFGVPELKQWQQYLLGLQSLGRKERIPNLISKTPLKQVLRNDLHYARFSHDGKKLLVQDGASIYVLNRDPLKTLFRIPAEGAFAAKFTPDDSAVVFHTVGLRVENWSIADMQMSSSNEIFMSSGCVVSELSQDGTMLACVASEKENGDLPLSFFLIDVATGEHTFTKHNFIRVPLGYGLHFSPNGKAVMATVGQSAVAVDVEQKKEILLKGYIKDFTRGGFAWLGNDRIVGHEWTEDDAAIISFPEGKVQKKNLPFGGQHIRSVTHGDFVIVGPNNKEDLGVYDFKKGQFVITTTTKALDVYDDVFVNDQHGSEVSLYRDPLKPPFATAELPPAPLVALSTDRFSDDGQYLALSNRARGALWDLRTGQRLCHVVGFAGVDFEPNAAVVTFMPPEKAPEVGPTQTPAEAYKAAPGWLVGRFDVGSGKFTEMSGLKWNRASTVMQQNRFAIVEQPADEKSERVLDVFDVRTGQKLWSRTYIEGRPAIDWGDSDTAVFHWSLANKTATAEIANDEAAKAKASAIKKKEFSWLLELIDLKTGNVLHRIVVDTGKGSWEPRNARAFGDRLIFQDVAGRTLVYSAAGDKLFRAFGEAFAVSADGKRMLLRRTENHLSMVDLTTSKEITSYDFLTEVVHAQFSTDGKRIYLLTADQTVYIVNSPGN